MSDMLTCNVCNTQKAPESFSRDARRKSGRQARCKPCAALISRRWRDQNPERDRETRLRWEAKNPGRHLYNKFRIRLADKNAILAAQGNVCAACSTDQHRHPRASVEGGWCLDHCHATGEIRGVLCWHCNVALGYVKDSPDRLRAMANYLETHAARNILRRAEASVSVSGNKAETYAMGADSLPRQILQAASAPGGE